MARVTTPAKSENFVHIYSTLVAPQAFTVYAEGGADMPTAARQVFIAGGTGVANKNLITPWGVHTAISIEDYEAIKDLNHFADFVNRGLIRVERKKVADIDTIVADMSRNDPALPMTDADGRNDIDNMNVPQRKEFNELGKLKG